MDEYVSKYFTRAHITHGASRWYLQIDGSPRHQQVWPGAIFHSALLWHWLWCQTWGKIQQLAFWFLKRGWQWDTVSRFQAVCRKTIRQNTKLSRLATMSSPGWKLRISIRRLEGMFSTKPSSRIIVYCTIFSRWHAMLFKCAYYSNEFELNFVVAITILPTGPVGIPSAFCGPARSKYGVVVLCSLLLVFLLS